MLFIMSLSLQLRTAEDAASTASDRPPFTTFIKDGEFVVSPSKEMRFLEWKKKNERKMREMNIKPKVYEYSVKPSAIMQQR